MAAERDEDVGGVPFEAALSGVGAVAAGVGVGAEMAAVPIIQGITLGPMEMVDMVAL